MLGQRDKGLAMYEQFVTEDPEWGWAWVGYLRQLNEAGDERYLPTLDAVATKLKRSPRYRDTEDMFECIGQMYEELGNKAMAKVLNKKLIAWNKKHS